MTEPLTVPQTGPLTLLGLDGNPDRATRTAVTGDVPGLSREAAWSAIIRLGGEVVKGVGPKTDLLVVGPGSGKKVDEARVRQIRVLPAAAFAALAADLGSWDGQPLGEIPAAVVPVVREPENPNVRAHRLRVVSGTFDGVWSGKVSCSCGWAGTTGGWNTADALGRAHARRGTDQG